MTTTYSELSSDWTEIGTGPAYIEADLVADIHFGDAQPANGTRAFHQLGGEFSKDFTYPGSQKIYARKRTHRDCGVTLTPDFLMRGRGSIVVSDTTQSDTSALALAASLPEFFTREFSAEDSGGTIRIVVNECGQSYAPLRCRFSLDLTDATFDSTDTYDAVTGITYTNGYNPQKHRVLRYWDFGDNSEFRAPLRVTDKSKRWGKGVTPQRVYATPGTYPVSVLAFEPSSGKWSRHAVEVVSTDPNTHFAGKHIAVNMPGDDDFSHAPAGAIQVHVDASGYFNRSIAPFSTYKGTAHQWWFKPGVEYPFGVNFEDGDVASGHSFTCSDPDNPAILHPNPPEGADMIKFTNSVGHAVAKFSNLHFRGRFDPATQLTSDAAAGENFLTTSGNQSVDVTFSRCTITNFRDPANIMMNGNMAASSYWAFDDCLWQDCTGYWLILGNSESEDLGVSMTGCGMYQSTQAPAPDAGADSLVRWNMVENQYIAKCDFFSLTETNAAIKLADSNIQATEFPVIGAVTAEVYDCIVEASFAAFWLSYGMKDNAATCQNFILDSNRFLATYGTPQFVIACATGITARNNYGWRPNVPSHNGVLPISFLRLELDTPAQGTGNAVQDIPVAPIHLDHNTMVNEMAGSAPIPMVTDANNQFLNAGIVQAADNLIHQPNTTPADTAFAPLDMQDLIPTMNTAGRRLIPGGEPDVAFVTPKDMPSARPTGTSPAIGTATGLRNPVLDLNGRERGENRDVGAFQT